jgi:hypothetical protein
MPTPEDKARENIDTLLEQCGWQVQDKSSVNLQSQRGVAVRELSFKTGEPDYTLFVDGKAIGTIEAKPAGHSLTGVEEQSEKYVKGVPFGIPAWRSPLPFSCESTGTETRFTNRLDPEPRSRNVFAFHRPETLLSWVENDALGSHGGKYYEMVMTNPPFGKKSSVTIVNEEGKAEKESLTIHRDDFWASTSNKQLNFLQHVFTILKQHGRAAIVVPDNVLFEGGAGETVRRELLKQADVHTLLRLPTGIFYAQGVKANVLFFDRKPAQERPWTEKLWIYDLRTNKHFTLKENQLKRSDLDDFVACWFGLTGEEASRLFSGEQRRDVAATLEQERRRDASATLSLNRFRRKETERFKSFAYEDLIKRDKVNLDIFWLKDESLEDSANLPPPDVIAAEIVEDLEAALEQFAEIAADLNDNESKRLEKEN